MIIITDKNGFKHKYKGRMVLHRGDNFINICAVWTDPPTDDYEALTWTGNVLDAFYPEDIKSIIGIDDDQTHKVQTQSDK